MFICHCCGKRKEKRDSIIDISHFIKLKQDKFHDFYDVECQLGEGSFSVVKRVRHKQSNLIRAVKQISKKLVNEKIEKLLTEFDILRKLDHPNIISLYEMYEDEYHYYIVMEYFQGKELFYAVQHLHSFSEAQAANYMKQILSALAYLDTMKIVHRDIKPENILVDDEGTIKIIDFGISKKILPDKICKRIKGTPHYMAPEQIRGLLSEKSDTWSCGIILYLILVGYTPFKGQTESQVLTNILTKKVEFEENDWKHYSQKVKEFILKLLRKDFTKRISAVEALEDEWLKQNFQVVPVESQQMIKLQQFQKETQLRKAITLFFTQQIMSTEDKKQLVQIFHSMDQNHDGQLSRSELHQGLLKIYTEEEMNQVFDDIFEKIDSNQSGFVDYTEFVAAITSQNQIMNKQKIKQTFKLMDSDGDGFLSRDEFEGIMGYIVDDEDWRSLVTECDQNGDGKISQNEFIDMIIDKK